MILKKFEKIVYNFNPSNNFNIEWDNLESQVRECTKIHQTNGQEKIFSNEIIDNANSPHKNISFTNTNEIEPYDVSYKKIAQSKNKYVKKIC